MNKPPKKILILRLGANETTGEKIFITDPAGLIKRQIAGGFEKIAVDFEHNTVPGSPEFERSAEPRTVAGYGVVAFEPGEGISVGNIEWTDAGRLNFAGYPDFSPAVVLDEKRNVTLIHSVALTRNGALRLSEIGSNILAYSVRGSRPPEPKLPLGVARLVSAFDRANAARQPARISSLSAGLIARDLAEPLRGSRRVLAAFQKQ